MTREAKSETEKERRWREATEGYTEKKILANNNNRTETKQNETKKKQQHCTSWSSSTGAFLLVDGRRVQFAGALSVLRLGGRLVHALLHALHHQVQQRHHRLVHVRSRGRARLVVGDAARSRDCHPDTQAGAEAER